MMFKTILVLRKSAAKHSKTGENGLNELYDVLLTINCEKKAFVNNCQ